MSDPQQSNLSKWVAFLLAPLIAAVAGFIVLKAKSWFGLDLTTEEVVAWLSGIAITAASAITAWVNNRGKYEIAARVGVDSDTIDLIATQVAKRLPPAPSAPPPGEPGSPAQPQAPPNR